MIIQNQFPAHYPAVAVQRYAVHPADPVEYAVLLDISLVFLGYAVYVGESALRPELAAELLVVHPDQKLHGAVVFMKR